MLLVSFAILTTAKKNDLGLAGNLFEAIINK
jgi:hypothetical protein